MKISASLGLTLLAFFLSSCNLYGGLSSPSNDEQYLVAARSCLDRGDYQCALDNYKKLSSAYSDTAISENSLTLLAQGQIFSISDLVRSLGTSLGSSASFSILAETLASRGITTGPSRVTIKTAYDNNTAIQNVKLKAFSQFIASLAMFNEVLANAVGADGKLTGSDIVVNPSLCRSSNGTNAAACAGPTGSNLSYNSGDSTSFNSSAAAWGGAATLQKLVTCAAEVVNQFILLGGSSADQGLVNAANSIKNISGLEPVFRYSLLVALDLN